MPIYEYQCGACGHLLETLQKVSEPPLTTCPACGAEALKKLISAAAFRLKGGGWYETDFKSGKKRNVAGEAGTATTESGGGDGTGKSEGAAKPADGGKADSGAAKGSSSSSSSSTEAG